MYKISGPVASYALKIGDKNIVLFGDWHESKDEQCSPCNTNCIYIVDLLKKMKPKSDLFIESKIHSSQWHLKRVEPKDVLTDIINTNFQKMFAHKGKAIEGVKIHYSDIRTLFAFAPFQHMYWYLVYKYGHKENEKTIAHLNSLAVISWCDTLDKLKQFIDLMLLSDDYIFDVSNLIPKKVLKHFTHKYDMMIYQRKYITRLRKQCLSLTKEHQQLLVRFHEDTCKALKQKHKQYDIAMKELIHHYTELPQSREAPQKEPKLADVNTVAFALLIWGSHVKDLYTLARMLHYLDKSNNIISYDGAAHSKTYALFFKKYMKGKLLHKEHNYKHINMFNLKISLFKGKEFRCVHLPKKVVKEVFDVPVQ
jgi:hypothetical protein